MNSIELYQNMVHLFICTSVSASLYIYYIMNINYFDYIGYLLVAHFSSDIFLTKKWDVTIHHIFGLTFFAYKYIDGINSEDVLNDVIILYSTEISSFFYIANLFLQEVREKTPLMEIIGRCNDLLFLVSFVFLRIYNMYIHIIANENTYITFDKYPNHLLYYIANHGMYILNLYWFSIICKIVAKPIIKRLDFLINPENIEYITTLGFIFLNINNSIFYYNNWKNHYIFDIIGTNFMTICHFFYNYKYLNIIYNKGAINYASDSIVDPFLLNIAGFHLKSFFALTTNMWLLSPNIIYFSYISHVLCYIINVSHISYLKNVFTEIVYDNKNYKNFCDIQYIALFIPYFLDILLISFNYNSAYNIHLLYTLIIMCIFIKIKPFYQYTNMVLYLIFIIQDYMLINCNIITPFFISNAGIYNKIEINI